MKKLITLTLTLVLVSASFSQVTDTVSLGASYVNEAFYSLSTGEKTTSLKNDWDIAFETTQPGAAIIINDGNGTELWVYPGDTSDWSALVDTTGLSTWTQQYNSEETWLEGAFNRSSTTGHPDYGWGEYNSISHIVEGNKLFVLKLSDNSYHKVWIKDVTLGVFTFQHAELGGSTMQHTLDSKDFTGKKFGYFSLQFHNQKDKEPAIADWDLKFEKYTSFVPSPYVVTGVLQATGVQASKAYPVNDPLTYTDLGAHTLMDEINIIGSDWKSFNMTTFMYEIADSTVYFVRAQDHAIWKVVFTGFGGSTTGDFIFTKQKLIEAGVGEKDALPNFKVYPNPASKQVNLVFDAPVNSEYILSDISGRQMMRGSLKTGQILHNLDISSLQSGIYIVTISNNQSRRSERLIISE